MIYKHIDSIECDYIDSKTDADDIQCTHSILTDKC